MLCEYLYVIASLQYISTGVVPKFYFTFLRFFSFFFQIVILTNIVIF